MMLSEIDVLVNFGGFWKENEGKLAPRWHQKSMPTSKEDLLKKPCFSSGKTVILKVLEVEFGTKHASKIN